MPPAAKKRLMIVDGHAVLHRAWHALPPLATKTGQVISGAYGFTMTLLNAIRQIQPTHLAVTFDLKGKTFRHHDFEAYKATREKQADEFYQQIPLTERILKEMGTQVFTAEGFEADDVIRTINDRAKAADKKLEVYIVTGDMDTLQLVDGRTSVFTMRKGMSDTVIYDPKAVFERYGLRPDQMVDYKALRGDPSDNIPGVKGIGEVTATALIGGFGSVEKLYASLEKNDKKARALKAGVREKLIAHKKEALQARELCRLRDDAPVDFSLDKCEFRLPARSKMMPILEEYQFMRLAQQFPDDGEQEQEKADKKTNAASAAVVASAPAEAAAAQRIGSAKELAGLLKELSAVDDVGFRTLTASDDPLEPGLLALGLSDGRRSFVVEGKLLDGGRKALGDFFAAAGRRARLVCHDLKREINVLHAAGVKLSGPVFDLMIASYLLFSGERRHSLGSMLSLYRSLPPEAKEASPEERRARFETEAAQLASLGAELDKELKQADLVKLNQDIELPLAAVLARMERLGIGVDASYLREISVKFGQDIKKLEAAIHDLAGGEFNINSPQQVKEVLFEKLKLSAQGLKKTAKGRELSTAASELEKLRGSHPIIEVILSYRELAKLKSTYIDALPELVHKKTGRIHASFNQAVTATGRLSSSDPNLQNIPTADTEHGRMVRNAFVAAPGHLLVAADYSQIELRIAAHIAGDQAMIKVFQNNEDIHWRTAVEMWGESEAASRRRIAKAINFGVLYGMGPLRLSEAAGITVPEARDFIDRYFAVYPGLAAYIESAKEQLEEKGYVQTLFGRRRFFRNLGLLNPRERAEAERQAVNMPIQGTQADMIKLAMVRIDDLIGRKYGDPDQAPMKLLSQVHDELVFEVRQDLVAAAVREIVPLMTGVCELAVPVAVNVSAGKRWGDMKKLGDQPR